MTYSSYLFFFVVVVVVVVVVVAVIDVFLNRKDDVLL
jgi:uncharacterized membrane protein YqiK